MLFPVCNDPVCRSLHIGCHIDPTITPANHRPNRINSWVFEICKVSEETRWHKLVWHHEVSRSKLLSLRHNLDAVALAQPQLYLLFLLLALLIAGHLFVLSIDWSCCKFERSTLFGVFTYPIAPDLRALTNAVT
jgi:hypothetical protein